MSLTRTTLAFMWLIDANFLFLLRSYHFWVSKRKEKCSLSIGHRFTGSVYDHVAKTLIRFGDLFPHWGIHPKNVFLPRLLFGGITALIGGLAARQVRIIKVVSHEGFFFHRSRQSDWKKSIDGDIDRSIAPFSDSFSIPFDTIFMEPNESILSLLSHGGFFS